MQTWFWQNPTVNLRSSQALLVYTSFSVFLLGFSDDMLNHIDPGLLQINGGSNQVGPFTIREHEGEAAISWKPSGETPRFTARLKDIGPMAHPHLFNPQ